MQDIYKEKSNTKESVSKRKSKYEYEIESIFSPSLSHNQIQQEICKKIARIIVNEENSL